MRQDLPTGTVTFLFTDVEGSTKLLRELGAEAYAEALAAHRRVIRDACARHDGVEVDTQGDAFFVAFATAPAALAAAGELTDALSCGPVRVRAGLHTGTPFLSDGGYVGVDVHRCARIAASGHGGQVLVSQETAALVDVDLRDLGEHRFKDLLAAERVYQLGSRDFPPLSSLGRTNLPVAAWPLLGREPELAEIRNLLAGGVRLLTLTGAGGSGKTRLALQAAAELADEFIDGTFFVALAPLRELQAVRSAVAEAVGLQPDDDVAGWLASRRVLLVLDNLEHLDGVTAVVADLLVGEVVVLATSRAPLHLSAERELPVEPLPDEAAAELFASRAAAAGRRITVDEMVTALCRRLDNLPLAIELAAARAKLLAPPALLRRLDEALPLLTGGAIDLPERQRTLSATIEWSHNLLDPDVQASFRRLSVFRGSFTLDEADTVAGADIDQVDALLDQSLLKPLGEERFFMLETIREYARELLDLAGETREFASRHAHAYLAQLEANQTDHWGPRRGEIQAWFVDEEDNLRAALDRLTAEAPIDAARAARLLHRYWVGHTAYAEERQRMHALLADGALPNNSRAALLGCLAELELRVGDLAAQEAAVREALPLVETETYERALLLVDLGLVAARSRRAGDAVGLAQQILDELERISEPITERQRLGLRMDAANILGEAGNTSAARRLTREALDEIRLMEGEDEAEAVAATTLAQLDLYEHDYEAARAVLVSTLATFRRIAHAFGETEALRDLGYSLLGLGRRQEARAAFLELLDLATENGPTPSIPLADALDGIALAAEPADAEGAARLRAGTAGLHRAANLANSPRVSELGGDFEQALIQLLGESRWALEQAAGAALTLDEAIELAQSLAR